LLGLGLFWWVPRHGHEEPAPVITSQAANLSEEAYTELSAELQLREEALLKLEKTLQNQRDSDREAVVSKQKVEEVTRQLQQLETSALNPDLSPAQLRELLEKASSSWRERLQRLKDFLDRSEQPLPVLPPLDQSLLARLKGDPSALRYRQKYVQLQQQLEDLATSRNEAFDADLAGRAERLTRLVRLRYSLLQRLHRQGSLPILEDPETWLEEVSIELSSFPLRKRGVLLRAWGRLNQRTGGGTALLKEAAWELLCGALALFTLLAALRWAQHRRGWRWWGLWALAQGVLNVLAWTLLDFLQPLVSLIAVYALWRIYGQVSHHLLETLRNSPLGQRLGILSRARRNLKRVGLFLLFQGCLAVLLRSLSGYGQLLSTEESLMNWLGTLVYWGLAWQWRVELGEALALLLPGRLGALCQQLCSAPGLSLLTSPLAVPLVVALALVYRLVALALRFEWGQRTSARVLLRWMEASQTSEAETLPGPSEDYVATFKEHPIQYPGEFLQVLNAEIEDWVDQRGMESRLVLHGADPVGLETVLLHLAGLFENRLQVHRWRPNRLHTLSQLLRELEALLQLAEAPGLDDLATTLAKGPRRLIVVHHTERLFLSRVGGFEALRALAELMARCRHQVFWCLALPSQTMRYLRLATPDFSLFPQAVCLPRWSEAELKQWILAAHQRTQCSYQFAPAVLRAAEATPGALPEGHYFMVLARLSGGHPGAARDLWLGSLGVDAKQQLVVGLPPRNPVRVLSTLPASAIYLLAALLRHGDLSFSEAVQVLGMSEAPVFLAWERCHELGVLQSCTADRSHIPRHWSIDIQAYLRERNLLDGD